MAKFRYIGVIGQECKAPSGSSAPSKPISNKGEANEELEANERTGPKQQAGSLRNWIDFPTAA